MPHNEILKLSPYYHSEFKKICPNMTKEQMDAAFAKFDKDKTGRINYTEFCSMLNKNNK